jgi:DNA repair exonuclease SbcCD ATPase subunit
MTEENNDTIDNSVLNELEQSINKLDEAEKKAIIEKLSKETETKVNSVKSEYEKMIEQKQLELEKMKSDYEGKFSKQETEIKSVSTQIEDMKKVFENTWANYKPDSKGLVNTSENPFKVEDIQQKVKQLDDPRNWDKNPEIKDAVWNEFKRQIFG